MMDLKVKRRLVKSNAGSVLVMSVILSLVVVLLGTAYIKYADHYRHRLTYDMQKYGSRIASLTSIYGRIVDDINGSEDETDRTVLYQSGGVGVQYNCRIYSAGEQHDGYSHSFTYTVQGRGYASSWEFEDEIVSTGNYSKNSFSLADWLYITEREKQIYRDPPDDIIRFWGPDTLDGKVHSNDMIHFQADSFDRWPVFFKLVSSCSTRFDPESVIDDGTVEFLDGYWLKAPRIDIPAQADSVRRYGYYYNGEQQGWGIGWITELTLEPEGFYIRHRLDANGSRNDSHFEFPNDGDIRLQTLNPYPQSKALFIEGECWVTAAKNQFHYNRSGGEDSLVLRGFSGQLTIGASGDIIIPQNIMYESSDMNGNIPIASMDVLGLISEKHILMWRGCDNNVTVRVQAGLAAVGQMESDQDYSVPGNRCPNNSLPPDGRNGTISVDGINCYGENNEKYQLEIKGCLIQRERGLIHTSHNGGLRGFVSKRYRYDFRFITNPPPHFFRTSSGRQYVGIGGMDNIFGLY